MKRIAHGITHRLDSTYAIHIIVVLGLALRLIALATLANRPLVGDATLYRDFAGRLLQGETINPLVPPAVGYYLALFYRAFGNSALTSRACILALYPAFAYLLYALASILSTRRSANLLTLFFSLYPLYLLASLEPITELPAVVLLLLTMYLFFRAVQSPSWKQSVLLGITLGLLCLTRPSTLPMVFCIPAYLGWRTKRIGAAILPFALSILLIGSWVLRLYETTGHFVMINYSSTQNVFLGNNPYTPLYRTWWFAVGEHVQKDAPPAFIELYNSISKNPWYVQNALFRKLALQHILARPDLFILRSINRFRVYFAFESYTGSLLLNLYHVGKTLAFLAMGLDGVFYCVSMVLVIVFLFTLTSRSEKLEQTLLIVAASLVYAAPYWFSVSGPIYHFPIVPLLGVLGARLVGALIEQPEGGVLAPIHASKRRRKALLFALGLFAYIQVEYACVMYFYGQWK